MLGLLFSSRWKWTTPTWNLNWINGSDPQIHLPIRWIIWLPWRNWLSTATGKYILYLFTSISRNFFSGELDSTLNNDHRKRAINFGEKWIKSVFNLPLIYSFKLLTTHLSLSRIFYFDLKNFEIIISEKFNGLPFLPQPIHPGWLLPTRILK